MKFVLSITGLLLVTNVFAYELCSNLSKTPGGNISVVCEDPSKLVPGPDNTQVFPKRDAFASAGESRIVGLEVTAPDSSGRTFMMGGVTLKPGVKLSDLVGLSGEQLFEKVIVDREPPSRIPKSAFTISKVEVESEGLYSSESAVPKQSQAQAPAKPELNCTYVKSENRTVNLTRFQPTGDRCQDTGCLPREIYICLATIACKGSAPYTTTCKSSSSGCPSVNDCVNDDSVTSEAERKAIQQSRSTGVSRQ